MKYELEELLPLVAELTEKYTSKESTSVTNEKANQLMGAVIYCINENENAFRRTGTYEVENVHEKQKAELAYERGCQLVLKKALYAKNSYDILIKEFRSFGNECYEETIRKGIPYFFQHYDARFFPQDDVITMGYPTIKPIKKQKGIDAVALYLSYIQREQEFLKPFSDKYVKKLLENYVTNYEESFFNVCSVVLRNVLASMIAGEEIVHVESERRENEQLIRFCGSGNREEIFEKLAAMTQQLVKEKYDDNRKLMQYLKKDCKDFSYMLGNFKGIS